MKNFAIVAAFVIVAVVALLYFVSPGLRAKVNTKLDNVTKWTDEAIKKDPIGYYNHVENRLTTDQEKLNETLKNLRIAVGDLSKRQADKRKSLEKGKEYETEFVDVLINADGKFPVTVRGKEYSEAQLRAQGDLIVAQNNGLTASITAIESALVGANKKIQELIVNKEKTDTELSMLKTKKEVFTADKLTSEGLDLVARIDEILQGNERLIEGNPVRSIEELIKEEEQQTAAAATTQTSLFDELVRQRQKDRESKPIQKQKSDESAPMSEKDEDSPEKAKPIFKQS